MSTDTSYSARLKRIRGLYLADYHTKNPTKQIDGPNIITSHSSLINLYYGLGQNYIDGNPTVLSSVVSDSLTPPDPPGPPDPLPFPYWLIGFTSFNSEGGILTNFNGDFTQQLILSFETINNIVWNGIIWVAVGVAGRGTFTGSGLLATSPDGIIWTQQTTSSFATGPIKSAAYDGNRWIIAGSTVNYGAMMTSPDGINWTNIPINLFTSINNIVWNGTIWLAVGNNSNISLTAVVVATSPDGNTWTLNTNLTDLLGSIVAIKWTGSIFVAVGSKNTSKRIVISENGLLWRLKYETISNFIFFSDIANNSTEIIVSIVGAGILKSNDGNIWTPNTISNFTSISNIGWNGIEWIAVGRNDTQKVIATSADSTTWNNQVFDDSGSYPLDFFTAIGQNTF